MFVDKAPINLSEIIKNVFPARFTAGRSRPYGEGTAGRVGCVLGLDHRVEYALTSKDLECDFAVEVDTVEGLGSRFERWRVLRDIGVLGNNVTMGLEEFWIRLIKIGKEL